MLPPVTAAFAPRRPALYPSPYACASPFRLPSLRMVAPVVRPAGAGGSPDNLAAGTPTSHKAALAFILSPVADAPGVGTAAAASPRSPALGKRRGPAEAPGAEPAAAKKSKKGSKFCAVEGCASRAKHARRCWKHGGSVKCKVADCANRAKSKGVCWSHGGGTVCAFHDCETISVSNGFCWAHGGGKRCAVAGCSKPAYERTRNLCSAHFRAAKARDAAASASAASAAVTSDVRAD